MKNLESRLKKIEAKMDKKETAINIELPNWAYDETPQGLKELDTPPIR